MKSLAMSAVSKAAVVFEKSTAASFAALAFIRAGEVARPAGVETDASSGAAAPPDGVSIVQAACALCHAAESASASGARMTAMTLSTPLGFVRFMMVRSACPAMLLRGSRDLGFRSKMSLPMGASAVTASAMKPMQAGASSFHGRNIATAGRRGTHLQRKCAAAIASSARPAPEMMFCHVFALHVRIVLAMSHTLSAAANAGA